MNRRTATRVYASHFGPYVEIDMPPGCDMMIVCVQKAAAEPRTILLPHQLYVEKINKLMAEPGVTGVLVMPCNSEHWTDIDLDNRSPAQQAAEAAASAPDPGLVEALK